jgi:3-methylcrotonyl-CoA carboxylase alpha subunit
VAGCVTNTAFLGRLCRQDGFRSANVDTGLIERHLEELVQAADAPFETVVIAALCAGGFAAPRDGNDPFETLAGWRHFASARQYVHLTRNEASMELELASEGDGGIRVSHAGRAATVRLHRVAPHRLRVVIDDHEVEAGMHLDSNTLTVFMLGETWRFELPDHLAEGGEGGQDEDDVRAPMPGLVTRVLVSQGDRVAAGDPLIIMEAMKMEQTLSAPRDGDVEAVHAREGEQVEEGAVLVSLARAEN